MSQTRVRSQDVAELAGVSRTTVSLVLSGRADSIPAATQQRILDAADKLGYVPSAAGRALRSGHTNVALCLLPTGMPSERMDELWNAIDARFKHEGMTCILSHSISDIDSLRSFVTNVTPSVVVACRELFDEELELLKRLGITFTVFYAPGQRPDAMLPLPLMHYRLGKTQAAYLADQGCTAIGYISGDNPLIEEMLDYRYRGVVDELTARGLKPGPSVRVSMQAASDDPALDPLFDGTVDGICAFNDLSAACVLNAARNRGVSIPGDMRVIGVDNLEIDAFLDPPLTSVYIPVEELTDEYMRIIKAIRNGRQPQITRSAVDMPLAPIARRVSA